MRTSFVLPETTWKIFLSHHSRQKLLVREIKRRLPDFIDFWIDEKDILIGDDLKDRILRGIDEKADYVVLFLDEYAVKSLWVKKEIEWALEKEAAQSITILLPLLIDKEALDQLQDFSLSKRKYIPCRDFSEESISAAALQLVNELFALEVRKPAQKIKRR